jgi:tellurium resistance protein TerD
MESNEVVCNYDLGEDFSTETAVQFASIYRYNGEWKFKAFGLGYSAGIDAFIEEYNFVA